MALVELPLTSQIDKLRTYFAKFTSIGDFFRDCIDYQSIIQLTFEIEDVSETLNYVKHL